MAYLGNGQVDTIHGGDQNASAYYMPKERKNGKVTSDDGAPMRTAEADPAEGVYNRASECRNGHAGAYGGRRHLERLSSLTRRRVAYRGAIQTAHAKIEHK